MSCRPSASHHSYSGLLLLLKGKEIYASVREGKYPE